MVSVKVNLLTFVPVLAFHMVMELGVSMTARRSRHESCTITHNQRRILAFMNKFRNSVNTSGNISSYIGVQPL